MWESYKMIIETIAIIAVIFVISRLRSKQLRKKIVPPRNWLIFEHVEKDGNGLRQCYRTEHKTENRSSPCFRDIEKLKGWVKKHGAEQVA